MNNMSYNLLIDWQKYETEFRSHKISMELRPLKRGTSILLIPFFMEAEKRKAEIEAQKKKIPQKTDVEREATGEELSFMYRVQEIAEKILPDHMRNFEGLTINNNAISANDLCSESIFASLVMNIIAELAKITQLTNDEVKN